MPGAGTRPDITTADPPARLLDLTRLVSRIGRGAPTGVDRVELAYLRHLVADPVPLFLLVRTPLGFLLLPDRAAQPVLDRIDGRAEWGAIDLIGRLARRWPKKQRQALASLRRLAVARCHPGGLPVMLSRHLPAGVSVLNVGQVTLTEYILSALRAVEGARITVLLHDAIPLDYPQYSASGIPEAFAAKLRATARHADQVIFTAHATRKALLRHLPSAPADIIAPLGVEPLFSVKPSETRCPDRPYFVTVGTIEPRKNHALLLDAWELMGPGPKTPALCILGRRGWRNEALFDRLDRMKAQGYPLVEYPAMDDGEMAAMLLGAQALLFPSLAEGYGLPPLEAAALGVPVLASDLAVLRETLGDFPVYLSPRDPYSWRAKIEAWARQRPDPAQPPEIAEWEHHFSEVLARA